MCKELVVTIHIINTFQSYSKYLFIYLVHEFLINISFIQVRGNSAHKSNENLLTPFGFQICQI